jgi:DNA polymerase-3 subunit gamma/tau
MRGATSPRLLLELMCAQVLLPAAMTDERSLLARLERLESGAVAVTPRSTPSSSERIIAPPQPQPSQPSPAPAAPAAPAVVQAPAPRAPAPAPVPPPQAAPVQAAAPAVSPPPSQGVTTDSLRQDWPQVLEMIKSKRRVAWIMLQNASVVSVEENTLMLRFPRQGDVKGFTTGQYDEMLKQALNARYGVNLMVRAVSGPTPPSGGGGSGGGGPRRPSPPPPPDPVPPASAPVPAAPAPVPSPEPSASQRQAPRPAPPPQDEAPFPSDSDFDPDDEDMDVSGTASAELTGVGLIQRELGGEIIGEYED